MNAFRDANDVLLGAVQGHFRADHPSRPDQRRLRRRAHRDVRDGSGHDGTGTARGDDRATGRGRSAIGNPLLEDVTLYGASGLLVNVTAGPNLTMAEFDEVGHIVEGLASEDATIMIGTVLDPECRTRFVSP